MTSRRFWVFIEQEEGKANPVSWELLGAATSLAQEVKDEAQAKWKESWSWSVPAAKRESGRRD
jgi:hypothetical protein